MSDYVRPTSLADALEARQRHPDFAVLAGGTDLLVAASQKPRPVGVIDLFGLGELQGVRATGDGGLVIGAATTYAAILASDEVRARLPILAEASREIGALQIQARGTVGGNLGTSSPVGDTLPVWLAADAEIELASTSGRRGVPYAAYCTGYRTTQLRADELIVAVHVPPLPEGAVQRWRKVGTRRAQSISKVMFAGVARVEDGRVAHVRLALGAVADRPVRVLAAEEAVLGQAPGAELAERAKRALRGAITPIDDVRSTAAYRLAVAENVVARFVRSLAEGEAAPDTAGSR